MGCASLLWHLFREALGCIALLVLAALVAAALLVIACLLWPGLRDTVSGLVALGLLIWMGSFLSGRKARR